MAMPAQPTEWTVDMVRALPDDGNRYEVIDGELFVTPAPSVAHNAPSSSSRSTSLPTCEPIASAKQSSLPQTSSCTGRANSFNRISS